MRRPIALTIAGSDSSGGAGIQADLKTFTVLGVYGASVVTALTAQNTRGVQAVHGVPPEFIAQQFDSVLADLRVDAAKTGMLADRVTVETVAAALIRCKLPALVVDPVMVATSGDVLLAPDAIDAVRRRLIPLADLLTPNLPEAARLLDEPIAQSESAMEDQGRRLMALGARAVLIKGGHGGTAEAVDMLVTAQGVERLANARIETKNTHGTGCTLSAAIAAFLASGAPLPDAVRAAKTFVWEAIQAGRNLEIGQGSGPVDHLYRFTES
jgi:hydroxymethylpyrimidine/phosphomethylpyrimidine kinase